MYINNQPVFIAETNNPEALKEWREHPNSLTDKLNAEKGSYQLELIEQKWIKPTWWDLRFLQIKEAPIFQREILMKHQGIEYWYARTIIPEKSYNLNPVFFKRLENESLRNLVFDNNKVHRVFMTNYPVDARCIEFHWVKKYLPDIQGIIWVRLAEFSLEYTESFYLMELLLPELENVI